MTGLGAIPRRRPWERRASDRTHQARNTVGHATIWMPRARSTRSCRGSQDRCERPPLVLGTDSGRNRTGAFRRGCALVRPQAHDHRTPEPPDFSFTPGLPRSRDSSACRPIPCDHPVSANRTGGGRSTPMPATAACSCRRPARLSPFPSPGKRRSVAAGESTAVCASRRRSDRAAGRAPGRVPSESRVASCRAE